METFGRLLRGNLVSSALTTSTPAAMRALLQCRPEVQRIRYAVMTGAIGAQEVAALVRATTPAALNGARQVGDVILSAVAVAMETAPGDIAGHYLKWLAGTRCQELPIAPEVARLCLIFR